MPMSEDNVTALFRASVVAARCEGEEQAYGIAARYLAELQRDLAELPVSILRGRVNDLRSEFEWQGNSARHIRLSMERRLARAGMELRDDTTPR